MAYVKSSLIPQGILDMIAINNAEEGAICSFNTDLSMGMYECICQINATGGNGTPSTPIPIVGHSELNLVRCGKNFVSGKLENINIESNGEIKGGQSFNGFYAYVVAGNTYAITTADINIVYAFYEDLPEVGDFSYNNSRFVGTLSQNTFTAPISGYILFRSNDLSFTNAQLELGSSSSTYAPYNGTPYLVSFGQTVYGGEYDANRGKVKPNVYYSSYNGEIITGRWLSSKDVYVEGNIPSTGAQVVCLDEYDTEIDVSELSVDTIVGVNNVFHDCNGTTKGKFFETVGHNVLK